MSMHNQGTTLAVHQRNSYFHVGLYVRNRKEKESGVQSCENSSHAADMPMHNPARGQVSVGPRSNWDLRGKLMHG